MNNVINKEQINSFLNSWADGILAIGKCYLEKEDYIQRALNFIEKHYAFDNENVMFKPTFTQEKIFRNDKESALSYFVGGKVPEDSGFAIKPWESIDLSEVNYLIENNFSAVMGTLHLKSFENEEISVIAFTFVLEKYNDSVKIKIHHSSEVK